MQAPRPGVTYRYWACDLRSGAKLDELPLRPSGQLPERISDVSTVAFTCDQSALPRGKDFIGVTTPGRTLIAVEREYDGDNTSSIPWAGIVTNRDAGSDPEATLNCATPAAYLGRRHVGTHTYNAGPGETDEQIIRDLFADAAPEGLDFILDVDCPQPRKVRYLEKERRTVLGCLRDLADMDNGPEWTVVTRWSDGARLAVEFVFLARPRLGCADAPNVRFDYPGSIRSYRVSDDFTEGHGGNHITGITSAGVRSVPARDEAALREGWPRWEEDIQLNGNVDADELAGVARAGRAKRARGQSTVALAVDMTLGPQLGVEWQLGDNIAWHVYGPATRVDPAPSYRHPDGHSETIRVIGYQLDPASDTLTPVLWSPYTEEEGS
jgi:hypothetical protein